ncbi:DUF1090 domain-containing protein [Dyella sp. ASV21]|jgi:hypothetical protein|uniref:DUF1090 domain-containing protein n=1 Tax=Dyella sp. ASV21 TaxID=2795114 RepID=UPI0018ECA8C6|nr:DUF1090 domain-containing protein [Dyella sp. ASV21]
MKAVACLSMLAALLVPAMTFAQTGGCDAKRQSIENEIAYAQSRGNTARVQGLQKALAEVNAHCTDASLQREADQKVANARDTLTEREQELQEAKDQGKSPQKIADRQRKVDEAHAKLEQALMDAGR